MTKYQLEDKKSQESLVDGRGMWHRLDKQPGDSQPAHIYTLRQRLKFQSSCKSSFLFFSFLLIHIGQHWASGATNKGHIDAA